MSAAVALASLVSPPGGDSVSTFTPLHLFECTITNAGMLVDSMTTRDLVSALRVLSSLHSRIVDVMEPSVGAACSVAEHHKSHCQPEPAAAFESADCKRRKRSQRSASDDEIPGSSYSSSCANRLPPGGSSVNVQSRVVKCESLIGGGSEADDDCLIMMDDSTAATAAAAAGQSGTALHDSFLSSSSYTASAASSTPELRAALKDSYKELKSAGAELFDFARPFDDPYNVQVTHRIIALGQARVGNQGLPVEVWRDGALRAVFNPILSHRSASRRCLRLKSKLARRQKSFEALLPELAPDELEQYRLVLTRDFTTSDEESEDERGRERLTVRELPWESDRVRDIKRRLDDLFLRRFATQKQRDQLVRCRRDGATRSSRPPPDSAPDWCLRPLPISRTSANGAPVAGNYSAGGSGSEFYSGNRHGSGTGS